MTTLSVDSLVKEFNVPSGTEVAVDNISLETEDGFLSLVGPSGCGKTTTLRCIAGLETPTSGSIEVDGKDISGVPPNKRNFSMMFQNIALYPHMNIRDNISYPLKVDHVSKQKRSEEAKEKAKLMQIEDLLDKYPGEISGGQQQRAALARTLVQKPDVFLMDEPLSDLDAKLKVEMRKEIQRVHKRVKTPTIYVTHDQEEAMTMSTQVVVMNNGRIEQIGTPTEIYNNPNNRFVAEFIGNPSMNFLTVRVDEMDDSSLKASLPNADLLFDSDERIPQMSEATVGFRPNNVVLDTGDGHIEGVLNLTEPIGDEMIATVSTTDGEEITATIPSESQLREDSQVSISFEDAHLFDPDTGDKIDGDVQIGHLGNQIN